MHIEKIKYFLDLYDCGSYTETARRNYISQTAVSQFIHSLEQEFQVQLFDRSVTPVAATQAGNLFYREASVLWEQYAGMKEKMLNFRLCIRGGNPCPAAVYPKAERKISGY